MKKYKCVINNLDCANCALKVEDALKKDKRLCNVSVNFNTSLIRYETDENVTLSEVNKIVKSVEPDAFVSEEEKSQKQEYKVSILLLALLVIILSLLLGKFTLVSSILMIVSYILLLYRPCFNALKMLIKNKSLNENALITISCLGAYFIGEHLEGAMVVILYSIGKILEDKAINKSKSSIKSLLEIKQDYANLKINDSIKQIPVEEIKIGDILVVKKGEKVPVDGIITKGCTNLDMSSLTGESVPVTLKKKDDVLSGSINLDDVIEMKATHLFLDSTISKILDLVSMATDKKTKTETRVAKISKIYTPTILILAILTVLLLSLFTSVGFSEALYRGLTFLVISCPCAIAISVPLSYFTGIGISSKNGILIKGSNYLDMFGSINKIVFDKTGTITSGAFQVKDIIVDDKNYEKEEIIDLLVAGEALSNHPIAKSIVSLSSKINDKTVTNFKEITGKGIEYTYKNKDIKVGSKKLCSCKLNSDLHINIDGKHVASILLDDGVKEGVKETLENLKKNNIKCYLFTGDKDDITKEITKNLPFDEIITEMLPQDKFSKYEEIHESGDLIAFVGDGINDAPLLKRADIGISMGSIGTDAAIEASDIVIMNDDIKKVNQGISISLFTNKIIKQNLIFAILTKVIILIFSIFGMASMWLAVFADTGVTLLTILNTLRIMSGNKS